MDIAALFFSWIGDVLLMLQDNDHFFSYWAYLLFCWLIFFIFSFFIIYVKGKNQNQWLADPRL